MTVAVLIFAGPFVGLASAQTCGSSLSGSAIDCLADIVTAINGTADLVTSGASSLTGSSVSTDLWVPYRRITISADGQACYAIAYRRLTDTVPPDEVPIYDGGTQDLTDYPPCPEDPTSQAQTRDPAVIASRYWEQIPLPRPSPYIAPGWAITGKLSYLETNGETRQVYTNSTSVGSLQIVASGAYYVDWGDGESTGPHASEGKPWPEGEITHDYVWAKTYNIVVTERWTATWSLGGQSGTLRELRTTGRIDNFPAREIQAVIRS